MKRPLYLVFVLILKSISLQAQQSDGRQEARTVLDEDLYSSARAAGMGGALSTLADGVHAPYYNPAGIGGLHWGGKKVPTIRSFHFPYLGVGSNENATDLRKEFSQTDGSSAKAIGKAIVDANAGKRQYGRVSGLINFESSRFMLLHYNDVQFAAFRKSSSEQIAEGEEVSASYRSLSGSGLGFSVTDSKGHFYLGAFSSFKQFSEFKGDFSYSELVRQDDRKALLSQLASKYTGVASNLGLIWVFSKYGRPALAVVVRDVGGSYFHRSKAPEGASQEAKSIKKKEELAIGFSFSPKLFKRGSSNFILEGVELTNQDVALQKKIRAGVELNFGGFGSEAAFSVRGGFTKAGLSGGLSLDTGLLQLELATQAVDIGQGNQSVLERRYLAVFSVNAADE